MKHQKSEDGAGLQDWLSYQARTQAAVHPETDVVDWDDGIEVQEEWLPRELCEQRLRDESERRLPSESSTPVVELQNVPLEYFRSTESKDRKVAESKTTQDIPTPDVLSQGIPAQDITAQDIPTHDLPCEIVAVASSTPATTAPEIVARELVEPKSASPLPIEAHDFEIDMEGAELAFQI